MILYHGSNQLITRIDLSKSKDFKDFGRGFYLTRIILVQSPWLSGPLLLLEKAVRKSKQLKYLGPEYIQYCFCTEKGIRQLILNL